MTRVDRMRGLAKITFGISVLFAAVSFGYFALQGRYVAGSGFAILIVAGGAWEYRRRLQDIRGSQRYEAAAEAQNGRDRRS